MKFDAAAGPDATARFHRELLERIAAPLLAGNGGTEAADLFQRAVAQIAHDTERWRASFERQYREQLELWQRFVNGGYDAGATAPADPRFSAPEWREPYFAYVARAYLLGSNWLRETVEQSTPEPRARRRNAFLARQFVDAMSPANFFWTNPSAVKQALATGGASLARGLQNMAADAKRGIVSTTDERAFEVGRNLAVTPGAVVFQNDYLQLIQYEPSTAKVFERPLLIVPPCINKYYILDLQPANSFVRYAVAEGLTVFMLSWRNMPATMGHATWDDYVRHGVMEAIRVVRDITGAEQINTLGFCIGGTLLACALAVLAARDENPAASLTLLATMLDYEDTGDLSVFIDEAYVARRERDFAAGGVVRGCELALAFASLRANDLIWRYVVNNYLLGGTPDAFDLLHWNADSTNLPGAMYVYYLRNMYLENNLRVADKLSVCETPVRLSRIAVPAYVLSTRDDHIVPWKTAYASARLLGGDTEFVLASSGHIAGVINPPAAARRSFRTGGDTGADADTWLAQADSRPGSWWPHWLTWLVKHAGNPQPARAVGSPRYSAIERAPGRYVKERADGQLDPS